MMKTLFGAAVMGLMMVLSVPQLEAGVVFDESFDGELPFGAASAPVIWLGPGTNLVRGNTGWADFLELPDYDAFRVGVLAGDELVAASLTVTRTVGTLTSLEWEFTAPSFHVGVGVPSSGAILGGILPLGAGAYSFDSPGMGGEGDVPAFADYEFSFDVRAVPGDIPEPSTLIIWSLLASLGMGLGWWRRRKRAA